MSLSLTQLLAIDFPLFLAPMAGVSTPELAAAVSNAGGLGSLGLGASSVEQAEQSIVRTRALTARPFNVNLFCHRPPARDIAVESAWLAACRPLFSRFAAEPPRALAEIYTPFSGSGDMLDMLLAQAPPVVSFHFGLPDAAAIAALRGKGILLAATATNLAEARQIQASGIDVIIAQGFEAGGHRGMFDPQAVDYRTGTLALVQLLKRHLAIPVVAAGGIMDGAGIGAMMTAGADGAQLGTAFLLCPESAADESYRRAIRAREDTPTWMTAAISGRPARCIDNDFCRFARRAADLAVPPYPLAYDAGKALAAAARARGEDGFGAHWAGQGINLIREMPAAALVATLIEEYRRSAK
ncbi:nitronate monooxygenase [Pluralibacter gergoviae]